MLISSHDLKQIQKTNKQKKKPILIYLGLVHEQSIMQTFKIDHMNEPPI